MVIAAGWFAEEGTLRLRVTLDEARSQRRTTSPPAKRAVDWPASLDQTQFPGVEGARRQSASGGGGTGTGVATGLGAGRDGGTILCSEHPARSTSMPVATRRAVRPELRFR